MNSMLLILLFLYKMSRKNSFFIVNFFNSNFQQYDFKKTCDHRRERSGWQTNVHFDRFVIEWHIYQ